MKSKKEMDYRKANPQAVYELKKVALRLRRKGKEVREICEITGLADKTVRMAFAAYDAGGLKAIKRLDWLDEKPFTTLFVTGNHENYWMLRELPVEEWHGGKVQCVRPNILHLMRGQLYEIEGRTFFTMGGATSHDVEDGILDMNAPDFRARYIHLLLAGRRRFRIIGKSWCPEELPSDEEYTAALDTLARAGWKADYVLTHCAPTSIAQRMNRHYQPDALTDFLEMVNNRLEFGCWLFGHYHDNRTIDPKHILLWENIIQLI